MNISKSIQDINLVDSFLSSASTENTRDAEYIAKLIIERATGHRTKKISVMAEKTLMGVKILGICNTEVWYRKRESYGVNGKKSN